jgi:phospholipase/carboxylesterase
MSEMSEKSFFEGPEGGVPYIYRAGDQSYPLDFLMLHGWGGDERAMWVLESVLPSAATIVSLRGCFPLDQGGYQWTEKPASIKTNMDDFSNAAQAIETTLEALKDRHLFHSDRPILMGFSQGAALSFSLAENLKRAPKAVICLAGYYPKGSSIRITDIPIFWGHGVRDDHVPVERARKDVKQLRSLGAKVQYCEADVGHKLGIECVHGLDRWLSELETNFNS